MRLFELLHQRHGVTEEAFGQAFQTRLERGGTLGEALIEKKLLTETELLEVMSELYGIPYWPDLRLEDIRGEYTDRVPLQFLKKFSMVPLESNGGDEAPDCPDSAGGGCCTVAVNSPESFQAMDDLIRLLDLKDVRIIF